MPEVSTSPSAPAISSKPVGSGGFLNPEKIIPDFNLASDMKIADFGSGSGYFTILIAQALANTGIVTAVDILESSLETVRTSAASLGLTNIQTIRGNLEVIGASGLTENSQDMVLMANVLFQNGKKREVMEEAKRILKSGGKTFVIDWEKSSGGPGPPDDLRASREIMKSVATEIGFQFEKEIDAGSYHFGLVFKKP